MSYELHLFRPKTGIAPGSPPDRQLETGQGLAPLDQQAIGDFLIGLGPAVRFGGRTELGEQYLYEDEQGSALEIMVSENQVALGFPAGLPAPLDERTQRVAQGIALALVARFGLVLYDPQRQRYIRASRASEGR